MKRLASCMSVVVLARMSAYLKCRSMRGRSSRRTWAAPVAAPEDVADEERQGAGEV